MKKYFISLWADGFFISGVSLLTFILVYFNTDGGMRENWVISLAMSLSWVINWPHFSATSYRLYRDKKNIFQFPITAVLVPILVIVGVLFSFVYPNTFAPWWVKLYLIWSPYHFSGQSLGISLLYARRAKMSISRLERFVLSSFIFSTFLSPTTFGERSDASRRYYGVKVPSLNLPVEFIEGVQFWMWASMIAVVLVYGYKWFRERKLGFTFFVFLPAITQYGWFVFGPRYPGFTEFVPGLHSLQYLYIAWFMQISELNQTQESNRIKQKFLQSGVWYGLNVLGGSILFYFSPIFASYQGVNFSLATGVILAGVQVHHFFVDGVIWKLRNPKIQSPLMLSWSDLK